MFYTPYYYLAMSLMRTYNNLELILTNTQQKSHVSKSRWTYTISLKHLVYFSSFASFTY